MKHNKPTKNQELPFRQKMLLRLEHHNWKENGLNNIKYKVIYNSKINTSMVSKFNIILNNNLGIKIITGNGFKKK